MGAQSGITGADQAVTWNTSATAGTDHNVKMDFAAISALKETFEGHADEADKVIDELLKLDETLKGSWDSAAHEQFTAEIEEERATFKELLTKALDNIYDIMSVAAANAQKMDTELKTGLGNLSSNDEEGSSITSISGGGE